MSDKSNAAYLNQLKIFYNDDSTKKVTLIVLGGLFASLLLYYKKSKDKLPV